MKWLKPWTLAALLALPTTAPACPLCREALAAPGEEEVEEVNNLPAAMNQSIYLMLASAYGSLAVVGFVIVRGARKNAAYRAERDEQQPPPA